MQEFAPPLAPVKNVHSLVLFIQLPVNEPSGLIQSEKYFIQ